MFGIVTNVLSAVRIFVLRKEISSTVPSIVFASIQSPTENGLSKKIAKPANKFFAISCAARATITPPNPRPAISPFRLYPNSVIIINAATI